MTSAKTRAATSGSTGATADSRDDPGSTTSTGGFDEHYRDQGSTRGNVGPRSGPLDLGFAVGYLAGTFTGSFSQSMFTPKDLVAELPLGDAGLGDAVMTSRPRRR